MGTKVRIMVLALILTVLLAAGRAGAAEPEPGPPNTAGPIITDTAVPIPTGQFSVQPFWSLDFTRGNFSPSWRRLSAGGDYVSFTTVLRLTYGPAENVEVYALIPAIQNWASRVNQPVAGNRNADFSGVGDITLVGKYQLFPETECRPAITPAVNITFPTGHASHLNPGRLGTDDLGGGAFTFTGGLLLSKWLKPFYFYGNIYYGLPNQAPPRVEQSQFDPLLPAVMNRGQITVNLASELVLNRRWVGLLEFYSSFEVGPLIGRRNGPPAALMGVVPGLEFILNPRWNVEVGVALDLGGKNTSQNCTPIITTTFTF